MPTYTQTYVHSFYCSLLFNHPSLVVFSLILPFSTTKFPAENLSSHAFYFVTGYLQKAFPIHRLGVSVLLFIHSFSISISSLILLSAPHHKVGNISLRAHSTPDHNTGDYFFSLSAQDHTASAPPISNQGISFLSQPRITQQGNPDLKSGDFSLSQPRITQPGHPPISNQLFSFQPLYQQGLPPISYQGILSLSPRSSSKDCPQSLIRGFFFLSAQIHTARAAPNLLSGDFFLSAHDHTARTAPNRQIGDFFSQPKITQQGLPPISNQGIFFLSAQLHTARTAPNL